MKKNIIDYESKTDCFERIKNVETKLKYGDTNYINPWITVFIPTYKRVDTLEKALDSVLRQKHCNFKWDIVIVDNEPDNGIMNETEKLIRKINNKRILYYRNSENTRPGDNFNIGFNIARGEWITFLHDDDLLISNALCLMGDYIKTFSAMPGKPLGAISARYIKFLYDDEKKISLSNLNDIDKYIADLPLNLNLYKLSHSNIWFTANIGGDIPSNGTTYNRKAAIESGGINEDFGISGDLILFYRMEKKYRVYSSPAPMGLYRWGSNSMSKIQSTIRVINDGYSFREYVYSKNIFTMIIGKILRDSHNYLFIKEVLAAKNEEVEKQKQVTIGDIGILNFNLPNPYIYAFFCHVIRAGYVKYKMKQCAATGKRAYKYYLREVIDS